MFGTIRKHQTWLWVVIIAAMILGLVIYFSPTAGSGGGSGGADDRLGSIDGERISREEFVAAARETYLSHLLMTGNWPDARSGFNEERETYQRLFFIKKLNDYNIHIDDEAVAQAARNLLTQFGGGRPMPLDVFLQQIPSKVSEDDFWRCLRHELGLQQLISVVAIRSELVTPQEAKLLYTRENQEIATHVVIYSGTNYQTSAGTPTPQDLQTFYTNQMFAYRLPERVQLNYVTFHTSNFLAQADKEIAAMTNLNEMVEKEYEQRGTNAFAKATPEQAKEQIRVEFRQNRALVAAFKKAESFMDELFSKDPVDAQNLIFLARSNNLAVKTTAPFDAETGPSEMQNGELFAQASFRLTAGEPFADRPFPGTNQVYVVGLARKIPSEVQPYEEVKDRVLADYKRTRAVEAARRAGVGFANVLGQDLSSNKTFQAVVSAASVKAVALPPISLNTTNVPQLEGHVNLNQFKRVAFELEPGKASEFSPTADGGFVVYVEKRLPIDEAKMNAELSAFTRLVRQSRRQEAINAWLQKEASESLRDTPIMQRPASLLPEQGRS